MTATLILGVTSPAPRTYVGSADEFGLHSTISFGMGKASNAQMGFEKISYAVGMVTLDGF